MSGGRAPRDPRRQFWVVDDFEAELCWYTGARYAIAVDSCTAALMIALAYERMWFTSGETLELPRRTYVGVMQAALQAGWQIEWTDEDWHESYVLEPTRVIDSARDLHRDMYESGTLTCISFQAGKQLPIGRGGAVLTDDPAAAAWLGRARHDGRPEEDGQVQIPAWHCYMDPVSAARGLWLAVYLPDYPEPLAPQEYPDLSRYLTS